MITWKKHEEYLQQGGRFKAVQERYDKAVRDAGEHVQNCKQEMDAILKREFQTGDDLSAEKVKARKKIEDAEKSLEAAHTERVKAYDFVHKESAIDKITVVDLIKDWNSVYRPMVRDERVKPIVERMANARSEYLNAVMDYYDLIEEYQFSYSEFKEMVNDHYRIHGHDGSGMLHPNEIVSLADLPQITDEELFNLKERKKMPNGVKRVKGGQK